MENHLVVGVIAVRKIIEHVPARRDFPECGVDHRPLRRDTADEAHATDGMRSGQVHNGGMRHQRPLEQHAPIRRKIERLHEFLEAHGGAIEQTEHAIGVPRHAPHAAAVAGGNRFDVERKDIAGEKFPHVLVGFQDPLRSYPTPAGGVARERRGTWQAGRQQDHVIDQLVVGEHPGLDIIQLAVKLAALLPADELVAHRRRDRAVRNPVVEIFADADCIFAEPQPDRLGKLRGQRFVACRAGQLQGSKQGRHEHPRKMVK